MNRPHPLLARRRMWILPAVLVVVLAGHGAILYYVSSHMVLSAAALSGAIILLVLKHVGLLGQLFLVLRRRRSRSGLR